MWRRWYSTLKPKEKIRVRHWAVFTVLCVLGFLLGHVLDHATAMDSARYWLYSFEMKHMQGRAPTHPRHTVVVLITDEDYWSETFAGRSPVNRVQLARVLETLGRADAQTVALDIDLRSPDRFCPGCDFAVYGEEDKALFRAMKDICKDGRGMVAGTSVRFADGTYSEVPSLYSDPKTHDSREEIACVHRGYLQLPHDLRRLPGQLLMYDGQKLDSFAMAAEETTDADAYARAENAPDRAFLFARFLSEKDFGSEDGPYLFSVKSLEEMAAKDPVRLRHDLAGRVVLIGGAWHSSGIGQGQLVDVYDSPMGQMPGVFLHANYIEALDGERGTFAPLPDGIATAIELGLAIALTLIGDKEIHALWKGLAVCGSFLFSFFLTYVLLENLGIFMDFLVPLCILMLHTPVEKIIAWRLELHDIRHGKGATHGTSED